MIEVIVAVVKRAGKCRVGQAGGVDKHRAEHPLAYFLVHMGVSRHPSSISEPRPAFGRRVFGTLGAKKGERMLPMYHQGVIKFLDVCGTAVLQISQPTQGAD